MVFLLDGYRSPEAGGWFGFGVAIGKAHGRFVEYQLQEGQRRGLYREAEVWRWKMGLRECSAARGCRFRLRTWVQGSSGAEPKGASAKLKLF
jgi:hypothetical protein